MTTFLLFDNKNRLAHVRDMGGKFGSFNPMHPFAQPGDNTNGSTAIELSPAVTKCVRPLVFNLCVSHASLVSNKAVMLVDPIEKIQGDLRKRRIHEGERHALRLAESICTAKAAFEHLGRPAFAQRILDERSIELTEFLDKLASVKFGEKPLEVDNTLAKVAGTKIPLVGNWEPPNAH